jgi:uncharacterized protein (DUF2236 family)
VRALASPDEYAELAPEPGSPVWRAFGDVRLLATSGYATLLQVAHPTVGHGVHQHSSFTEDPWGRLLRTLDYVHGTVYGGPELAGEIGRRVRGMHRGINGSLPDGRRYSAFEPKAFAWVHATLASSIVEGRRHLIGPMSHDEKELFWRQWIDVGRLVGVQARYLPVDWAGFESYFARVAEEELEWTPAVREVLDMLRRPLPPALRGLHPALWRVLRSPLGMQLDVLTVGLLPPPLRERLRLRHTRADHAAFLALTAAARASGPFLRGPLRNYGPVYVRWRRLDRTRDPG